jgi:hypothetical protein
VAEFNGTHPNMTLSTNFCFTNNKGASCVSTPINSFLNGLETHPFLLLLHMFVALNPCFTDTFKNESLEKGPVSDVNEYESLNPFKFFAKIKSGSLLQIESDVCP